MNAKRNPASNKTGRVITLYPILDTCTDKSAGYTPGRGDDL